MQSIFLSSPKRCSRTFTTLSKRPMISVLSSSQLKKLVWLRLSAAMVLSLALVRSCSRILNLCSLTFLAHAHHSLKFSRYSPLFTAPTNDAFDALPEGTVEGLLADIETLTKILLTHCFEGNIVSSMVTTGPIKTLSGNTIEAVVTEEGAISFDGANVILADSVASNGIGHVIDKVIVPKSDEESTEPSSAGKYGAAVAAAAVSAGFAMLI